MGDFTTEYTTSKTPVWAKKNRENIDKIKPIECRNCKSMNTICIYERAHGCNIGWTIEEEFLCNDCGYFTQYIHEYES